jgi:hypothetical protein
VAIPIRPDAVTSSRGATPLPLHVAGDAETLNAGPSGRPRGSAGATHDGALAERRQTSRPTFVHVTGVELESAGGGADVHD